ncbi:caspase-10 isoform X1 [Octodon degus]|uniref:Caspase-10 isoform X1 n=1 Tax=Octodon degus TaxID=10160 RepID=A0A6P6E758_OCTDE|nr:caspase-10 isoform X1 [Octodon degus]XP_023568164.1 caspase-10 isoform X1 [Octodon degus]
MASSGGSRGSSSDEDSSMNFRETLLRIDASLGAQDVEGLKFLCMDKVFEKRLERCSSASDLFHLLLREALLSEKDPFFLAELLYSIKQHSLLRHLGYTRERVEQCLPARRRLSLFRSLLYELSEAIDAEALKGMTFLLYDHIPKTQMTSLSLLVCLEKQTLIAEDDLTLLEQVFKEVTPHLVKRIENYRREKAAQEATPPTDREVKSLNQGEEEVFSQSEIKQFIQALPEADMYRMNRKHRGLCVIINNYYFKGLSERMGTHTDAESLKCVFQWLGFAVHMHHDVTGEGMRRILREQKSHPSHADADCFVFCLLTHGGPGGVYTTDKVFMPLREITSHFTAQQCQGLAHKPKLFFIQACQGEAVHPSVLVEADAVNPECVPPSLQGSIPDEADFLLGLATVPGYVSFRHKEEGSWYIQSLCSHLKSLVPRQQDILSILTAVNHDVSQQVDATGQKKQMPQPAFTLRKKVVFPVPLEALRQ